MNEHEMPSLPSLPSLCLFASLVVISLDSRVPEEEEKREGR